MKQPKFNLTPAHQVTPKEIEKSKRTVTINTKMGYMFFPIADAEAQMMVGKFLQFYVDVGKNVLAWKIFSEGKLDELEYMKKVEKYVHNGQDQCIKVSITKAMKTLSFAKGFVFKKLELGVYNSTELIGEDRHYYYVEIPKDGAVQTNA